MRMDFNELQKMKEIDAKEKAAIVESKVTAVVPSKLSNKVAKKAVFKKVPYQR